MALDLDAVKAIATLAQIGITDEELPLFQDDLSHILGFVEQLQGIDTTGVEPLAHAVDITPTYREDAVTESDQRQRWQTCAPAVEAGLYLAPRVIE